MERQFNFNIGIFGHVDSGKTSLARALSTVASTAAFDAHPQSRERGITLDLGFSSFVLPLDADRPPELRSWNEAQITVVDCPGHASLIRTVIGGAQIIDLVLLVVDAVKGVQTQTAECLLLAEITRPGRMIVVFNKVDLLPETTRPALLDKLEKRFRKTLESTSFRDAPFVRVSAAPAADPASPALFLDELFSALKKYVYLPSRSAEGKFLLAADHCFPIRGQGTVVTGTVLSGSIKTGATVRIPALGESRKVKTMQMFKRPVDYAMQGDRVALCLTQLEAKQFERGLVCDDDAVLTVYAAVVSFHRIAYFKGKLAAKSRFHISIGHETVMASCTFFRSLVNDAAFSFDAEYEHLDEVDEGMECFALLTFDRSVICPPSSLYIASRLDADIHANSCRLAFHGRLVHPFVDKDYVHSSLAALKVFKMRRRVGQIDRLVDERTIVAHSLFKKETALEPFVNMKVSLSSGEAGHIEGGFGQSGKVRVFFPGGLHDDTLDKLRLLGGGRGKKKAKADDDHPPAEPLTLILTFKRYIYDPKKRMVQ